MTKRTILSVGLLSLGLLLSACAKYESFGFIDNNCSQGGGYYDPGYCSSYVAE